MKVSLENYLRNKLNQVESMSSFELATDTIRCWIDDYNNQLRKPEVMRSVCPKCEGKGWYFVDEWIGSMQGRKDCKCNGKLPS